jgi:hypothetical protein
LAKIKNFFYFCISKRITDRVMKFSRVKERTGAELSAQIEAAAAQAEQVAKDRRLEFTLNLGAICAVFLLDSAPKINDQMTSYRLAGLNPSRRPGSPVRTAQFTDGIIAIGMTEGHPGHYKHHLSLPSDGIPVYNRRFIYMDSDLGYLRNDRSPTELTGVEAIAKDDIALAGVAYLAGAVAIESETRWPNAITRDQLGPFHIHAPLTAAS